MKQPVLGPRDPAPLAALTRGLSPPGGLETGRASLEEGGPKPTTMLSVLPEGPSLAQVQ